MMNCTFAAAQRAVVDARRQGREPLAWYLAVLAAYAAKDREEAAARAAAAASREADCLRREKSRRAANGGAFGKMGQRQWC